ncbi:MAG: hypothetical protein V7679_03980 [Parasphingorhabdus sp.]
MRQPAIAAAIKLAGISLLLVSTACAALMDDRVDALPEAERPTMQAGDLAVLHYLTEYLEYGRVWSECDWPNQISENRYESYYADRYNLILSGLIVRYGDDAVHQAISDTPHVCPGPPDKYGSRLRVEVALQTLETRLGIR